MTLAEVRNLAGQAALFSALRQVQLATLLDGLGPHRWGADLEAGRFWFTSDADESRTVEARARLVASIAPGPRSLVWAWALPQGDPTGTVDQMREYGAAHGISALTQAEVPFPDDAGDPDGCTATLAHVVGGAAVEITGLSPYYSMPSGRARGVVLLDAPLAPLTVAGVVPVLPRLLPSLTLPDARRAVWDLARLARWQLAWADEACSGATLTDATGSMTVEFDTLARISRVAGSLRGQAGTAPAP